MNLRNAKVRSACGCAAALMAISLLGCSKAVLDWRNAEMNNGLIYSGKANEPFTGEVTNVPQSFLLQGENGLENFANIVRMSHDWEALAVGRNELPTSFCTVSVKQGWVDGDAQCTDSRTGEEGSRMSFKKGALDGKFVYYNDGKHVADGAFDGGLPDGTQKVYGYRTGKLIHVVQWKGGVVDGTEQIYSESTDKLVLKRSWSGGKLDGTEESYADDGKQLLQRVSWKNGLKEGAAKTWSANGDLLADTVWSGDKLVSGKIHDGKGVYEFKDGQLDGPATYFGDDGTTMSSKGTYSAGKRTGPWEDRRMSPTNPNIGVTRGWFSVGGLLANVPDAQRNGLLDALRKADTIKSTWVDGHMDGDVQIFEGNNLVASLHIKNDVVDGPLQYLSHSSVDGKDAMLSYTFSEGRTAGAPEASASQGAQPLEGLNLDRCVVNWAHAFHREAGSETPISADQMDEWKGWCSQGKQAPNA